MKIQLKSDEDLTIVTKGGGNVIVPNNTDTSTDKTLATVDQIGPGGGDKANSASLAAPYESDRSSAYVVGDYVTHEGTLYKCKSDTSSPPGEWDDNNWDPVTVTDEMGGGGEANVIDAVKVNGVALTPDANKAVNIVKKVWAASATYASATGWTVTPEGSDFSLADGDVVFFIASNSATNNVKANVGGSGAINIVKAADYNHPNVTQGDWSTGDIVVLQYSGKKSLWVLLGAKKAPLSNPAFTGTPTAPTAPAGTNTTQIATTEFVQQEISNLPDSHRIVSRNGRTEVVSNQDGTASIIDNESGQKGINVPEGFDFTGITPIESGDISLVGPYEIQGRWYWLPSTVDPETFDPSSTADIHVVLGGDTSDEPNYVIVGIFPAYNITGWNTDSATLTRTQSEQAYQHGDITVCDIASEKTVATTDQIPTDIVSHQELDDALLNLDDALFNKVSQNAQFRMSIKDDGKVVVSGCRYRSANSTTQPFSNTYCVVSSETSLFDGGGGKIDFKIFNYINDELLYRAVGYETGNWTVLQNNLTSEAASYLPNVGGNIQFNITISINPENKVLGVILTGSSVILQPWSNFTSWADSKTKTLATLQNIAPDFSMDSTYEVGDYVTYDGSLWKCNVAVTTAGQWTGSDNWEQFIVMDEINSKIGDINSVLDAINGEEI